jgi:hypothetical protein
LEVSRHTAAEVLEELDANFKGETDGARLLCFAPHALGENGVFKETDTQIRNYLRWGRIAPLDLGPGKLSNGLPCMASRRGGPFLDPASRWEVTPSLANRVAQLAMDRYVQ